MANMLQIMFFAIFLILIPFFNLGYLWELLYFYLMVTWLSKYIYIYFLSNDQGPGGITVKKTTMAIIVGIYDEPMTPGQCNMIVERLGDYLIEQGY